MNSTSLYYHSPNPSDLKRGRIAIFEKNGLIGAIGLAITETVNAVSTLDTRTQPAIRHKSFETPVAAEHWYTEYVIATVSENFWHLAYNGPRNFG